MAARLLGVQLHRSGRGAVCVSTNEGAVEQALAAAGLSVLPRGCTGLVIAYPFWLETDDDDALVSWRWPVPVAGSTDAWAFGSVDGPLEQW